MESAFITGKDSGGNEFYIEVDAERYDVLKEYNWRIDHDRNKNYAVARRNSLCMKQLYMHHFIVGTPMKGCVVDHKDGNGLNNTADNLRIVTKRQNGQNLSVLKTSRFPGVRLHKGLYEAKIKICGVPCSLGYYKDEREAYEKYCNFVRLTGQKILDGQS